MKNPPGKVQYISLSEAYRRIQNALTLSPRCEEVPVKEAYGRFLFEDVIPEIDMPQRDMAHYDGYAVIASDTATASPNSPVHLKVVRRIRLGDLPDFELRRGEACGVPTGGFLPRGADAVIMREAVALEGETIIKLSQPVTVGAAMVRAGEDISRGRPLLRKGYRVRAQDVGALLAARVSRVKVAARPRVAILAIGSELVEEAEEASPGKTVASHNRVIANAVEADGGVPLSLGIVPDDVEAIKRRIGEALEKSDMVLTIGGSSVGREDFTTEVIDKLGEPGMLFRGIMVHPGRMGAAAAVNGKPVVVLPGLIQSTVIVYCLVAYPILRGMLLGSAEFKFMAGVPKVTARIAEDVVGYAYFTRFADFVKILFVQLRKEPGGPLSAAPLLGDTSLVSLVTRADGWAVIPEGKVEVRKGEEVDVYLPPAFSTFEALAA